MPAPNTNGTIAHPQSGPGPETPNRIVPGLGWSMRISIFTLVFCVGDARRKRQARLSVVVCTKSVAAQSGQGNWKSKSLRLGKGSLGDPSSEDGGWRKKIGKEKRSRI